MAIFASANGQPLMCAKLKRTQEDKWALIRKVGTYAFGMSVLTLLSI